MGTFMVHPNFQLINNYTLSNIIRVDIIIQIRLQIKMHSREDRIENWIFLPITLPSWEKFPFGTIITGGKNFSHKCRYIFAQIHWKL